MMNKSHVFETDILAPVFDDLQKLCDGYTRGYTGQELVKKSLEFLTALKLSAKFIEEDLSKHGISIKNEKFLMEKPDTAEYDA